MNHAVSFDTLAYAKRLESHGVDVRQAEAQAEALADILEANFVTKKEQKIMVDTLSQNITLLRAELKTDMAELRTELKTDMAELRTELKTDMAGLRTELKTDIAELRAELKTDIGNMKVELIKWGLGISVTQGALIVSVLKFFH